MVIRTAPGLVLFLLNALKQRTQCTRENETAASGFIPEIATFIRRLPLWIRKFLLRMCLFLFLQLLDQCLRFVG
jgi:hypothetical protein